MGVDDVPEGLDDIKKSWLSEGLLAVFEVAVIAAGASTRGALQRVFIGLAVGGGLLLIWSLTTLVPLEWIMRFIDRPKADGDWLKRRRRRISRLYELTETVERAGRDPLVLRVAPERSSPLPQTGTRSTWRPAATARSRRSLGSQVKISSSLLARRSTAASMTSAVPAAPRRRPTLHAG